MKHLRLLLMLIAGTISAQVAVTALPVVTYNESDLQHLPLQLSLSGATSYDIFTGGAGGKPGAGQCPTTGKFTLLAGNVSASTYTTAPLALGAYCIGVAAAAGGTEPPTATYAVYVGNKWYFNVYYYHPDCITAEPASFNFGPHWVLKESRNGATTRTILDLVVDAQHPPVLFLRQFDYDDQNTFYSLSVTTVNGHTFGSEVFTNNAFTYPQSAVASSDHIIRLVVNTDQWCAEDPQETYEYTTTN